MDHHDVVHPRQFWRYFESVPKSFCWTAQHCTGDDHHGGHSERVERLEPGVYTALFHGAEEPSGASSNTGDPFRDGIPSGNAFIVVIPVGGMFCISYRYKWWPRWAGEAQHREVVEQSEDDELIWLPVSRSLSRSNSRGLGARGSTCVANVVDFVTKYDQANGKRQQW